MLRKNLSVVIPNFNGKDMLEACLPSVLSAVKSECDDYEIIVVDDGSTDGSVDFLSKAYPQIKVLETKGRKGSEFALNLGYSKCTYDLVLQLDSDAKIKTDFCRYIFKHFDDNSVFAIAPRVFDWEGRSLLCGKAGISFQRGMLSIFLSSDTNGGLYSLFASGCASVFNKAKVLALGGYDVMYNSAHLDEIDLAYRAWKRGWKVVYEPKCIAYHFGSATRSKIFVDNYLSYMKARNQWLFMWKNLTDPVLTAKHLFWLPTRLIFALLKGNRVMLTSFFGALKELKGVLKKRRHEKLSRKVSDKEILKQFI